MAVPPPISSPTAILPTPTQDKAKGSAAKSLTAYCRATSGVRFLEKVSAWYAPLIATTCRARHVSREVTPITRMFEVWAWGGEVAGGSSHAIDLLFTPSASDALGHMAWHPCNLDDDCGLLKTAVWHAGSIIESAEDLKLIVVCTLGNRGIWKMRSPRRLEDSCWDIGR